MHHNEIYQIILISAVSLTCVFSIIGSSAIIFSFLAFRQLRNTICFILFNLSIADLIIALSNLAGSLYSIKFRFKLNFTCNFTNFGKEEDDDGTNSGDCNVDTALCKAQAAVGLIGTDASILWTIVFIVYMYCLLACCKPRYHLAKFKIGIIIVTTVMTWLVPITIFTVYAAKKYFVGYNSTYSPAFCTINISNTTDGISKGMGYDIFIYASFIILPIFLLLFFFHLGCLRRRQLGGFNARQYLKIMHSAEIKLVLIPIFFLLIRVWSLALDIWTVHIGAPAGNEDTAIKFKKANNIAFNVLIVFAGIGDSAQGLVNGILFILLTETVRYKMANCCTQLWCCCQKAQDEENDLEETVSPFLYRRSISSSSHQDNQDGLQDSYGRISGDITDSVYTVTTLQRPRSNSMSNFSSDIPYGSFNEKEYMKASMELSIDN